MSTIDEKFEKLIAEKKVAVREGKAVDEVINLINDEKDISLLVLGADTKSDSAGPVVSYLTGRGVASCRIPIVIVPGNMTDEQIDAIT